MEFAARSGIPKIVSALTQRAKSTLQIVANVTFVAASARFKAVISFYGARVSVPVLGAANVGTGFKSGLRALLRHHPPDKSARN